LDLPTLWNAPTTTPSDRKEVLRLLIEEIVLSIDRQSEWVDVMVRWAGGHQTQTRIRRPVGKLARLERHDELLVRIRKLRAEGYGAGGIADTLNAEGWVTPTQRNTFNERLIRAMLHRYGSVPKGPKRPPSDNPDEWWLTDVAAELGMPRPTLYGWLRRGWLQSREHHGKRVVIADAQEIERLRSLRRSHPSVNVDGGPSRTSKKK